MSAAAHRLSPEQVPCLPQQDSSPGQRREAIQALREVYLWDHGFLPPFALMRLYVYKNPTPEQLQDWRRQLPEQEWPGAVYLDGRKVSDEKGDVVRGC